MAGREGHRRNLRKRFLQNDLRGLLPHEVIELLLTYCIPRRDVKPQAHALIDRFNSLDGVLDAGKDELLRVAGIGPQAAQFLALIRAIAQAYWEQKSLRSESSSRLRSLRELAEFWRVRLRDEQEEHMEIAFWDGNRLLPDGVERLASGTADSVAALPRQLLCAVLQRHCSAVVLCHNHPNGIRLPSEHDERLTRTVQLTLQTIGVRLLDHFVVADGHVFSIVEGREIG
ncbi:MAG: hypothetical protein LBF24_02835 [Puniceicoccales bacterium]|nr:hypothetical protein [Puniceicoccales bacterium]